MGVLVPFLIALGVALLLVPVTRWLGVRARLVDRPFAGGLTIHARPVSVLGGPAVLGAALAGAAAAGEPAAWPILVAAVTCLVTGLADDLRPLAAWGRTALLAGAGTVAAAAVDFGPLGLGTVALVLVTANGVNLVDGQDGLAGGLGVTAALGLAAVAAVLGSPAGLALALAGGLVAFLAWNRPPASIFLGNGGAYGVGGLLGVLAAALAATGWRGLLAAGVALGMLALEVVLTVARRLGSRAPLAGGDRGHTYDVLARRVGRDRSTYAFWGLGAVAAGLGVAIAAAPVWAVAAIGAVGAASGAGLSVALWPRKETAWTRS